MTAKVPTTGFDIRRLTEDQRAIAEDIASSMGFGHEDACDVWSEDPDGCSCPLLESVAGALHDAGVVEMVQEVGWDPATLRGDRLVRRSFDPHPLEAEGGRRV